MAHAWKFRHDPAMEGHEGDVAFIASLINRTLSEAGATLRTLVLQEPVNVTEEVAKMSFNTKGSGTHRAVGLEAAALRVSDFVANAQGWNNGPHVSRERRADTRGTILKRLLQVESLGAAVLEAEAVHGRYDYVIVTTDDFLWMRPFSLRRALSTPDSARFFGDVYPPLPTHRLPGPPRGYHLRCIKMPPSMSSHDARIDGGVPDYFLLLEREVADPFLALFTRLLMTRSHWPDNNIEAFLARVAVDEGIHLAALPAALVPGQRAGRMFVNNATVTCLHKICDSSTPCVEHFWPLEHFPACAIYSDQRAVRAIEYPQFPTEESANIETERKKASGDL